MNHHFANSLIPSLASSRIKEITDQNLSRYPNPTQTFPWHPRQSEL